MRFHSGVTVRFLNSFTSRFDCWDWPTWRVVRDIVRPATAAGQITYFDAVMDSDPAECGPPETFVSHSWAGRWGTVVGAASYGSQNGDRRVWLDVFAVRQWPHADAEFDFQPIVQRCRSLILAVDHDVVEESQLDRLEVLTTRRDVTVRSIFPEPVRRKLPLARSWCLAEIVAAHLHGCPVIVLVGESVADPSTAEARHLKLPVGQVPEEAGVPWRPDRPFGIASYGLINVLSEMIDVEEAEAALEEDRRRINADIEASLGYERFNVTARTTVSGASLDPPEAEVVLPLLCDGDDRPLRLRASRVPGIDRPRLLGNIISLGAISMVRVLADEYQFDLEDDSLPALWVACSSGQLEIARMLVTEYRVSVETRAGNRMTPLAAAAAVGHLDAVELLLAHGAPVDGRARVDRTPLINAAMWGHNAIVSRLSRAGANPDLVDAEGYSALAHAVFGRHASTFAVLISECGADVNLRAGPADFSALHWAVRHGQTDIARMLVNHGADFDIQAADGTPPLITAVLSGRVDAAVLLIRAGARVGATNSSGFGLLAAAVANRDPGLVHALAEEIPRTEYDALTEQRFGPVQTPLDMAILESKPAMVTALVDAFACELRHPANHALPPIFLAAIAAEEETPESLATLSVLVERGVDVAARDGAGASVLFVCHSARALAVLTADPTANAALRAIVDDRIAGERSALHFAAAANRVKVVRALVNDLGAEVDLPGPGGATALAIAVRQDATATVAVLLDAGGDPRVLAPNGMTLLQVAETYAGAEMVALVSRFA